MKRALQLSVGVAVAGLFVWMIARHVDGPELKTALMATRPGWVAAAVVLFLLGYACRIERWRMMLTRDNPTLSWFRVGVPFMASIAGNNVLPFRAGDALRIFGFQGWLNVPVSALLATVLVERLLDLLSLLIAFGLVLVIFDLGGGTAGALVGMGGTGLIVVGLGVMAVLLFPQVFEPLARFCIGLIVRVSPGIGAKLGAFVDNIFATLRHLAHGPRMALLVLWSAFVWGFEGAVFWSAANAVPALIEPMAGWLALPVGTLATLLPSTPGYVGTFDFFTIKAAEAMGNPAAAAAAFALLVHLILWLPATLIGGACVLIWSMKKSSEKPSSNESQPAVNAGQSQ